MPLEKPIQLGPNTFYFHGDLWSAEELRARFGIDAHHEKQEHTDSQPAEALARA